MLKPTFLVLCALFCLSPLTSHSQQPELVDDADESDLEVVIVTGVRIGDALELDIRQVSPTGLDNGDLMRLFPGGNRNSNGPLRSLVCTLWNQV